MSEEKPLINYVREAAVLPLNVAFATVSMLSLGAMLLLRLPGEITWGALMLMGAAEMFYLRLMPQSKRFRAAVEAKHAVMLKAVEQNLQTVSYLKDLREKELERFSRLFETKNKIIAHLQKKQKAAGDERLLERLDQLETHYVQLLYAVSEYQKLLERPDDKGGVEDQINKLEAELQGASPKVADMIRQRIALLKKRSHRTEELKEDLRVALIQLDNLDDTFSLILHEASSLSNIGEIHSTVGAAIQQVETQRLTMRELDNILRDETVWLSITDSDASSSDSGDETVWLSITDSDASSSDSGDERTRVL
jgi:hypothetical protein